MSTSTPTPGQARQPAGVPTGGQFAAAARTEATIALAEPAADDLDFARETLGPDATDDEVRNLADQRLDRDEPEMTQPGDASSPAHEDHPWPGADFPRQWPTMREADEIRGTVRTTNGGEISGVLSSHGTTYAIDVRTEDGRYVPIMSWRVAGVRLDPTTDPTPDPSFFPPAPLTPRDVEHLVENRGRFQNGYDSDDINRVLGRFESADLVCAWEYYDNIGYGGHSEFAGIAKGPDGKRAGSWRSVHPDVWEFLSDPETDLDPETIPSLLADEVFDGEADDLDGMSGDGFCNLAAEARGFHED